MKIITQEYLQKLKLSISIIRIINYKKKNINFSLILLLTIIFEINRQLYKYKFIEFGYKLYI